MNRTIQSLRTDGLLRDFLLRHLQIQNERHNKHLVYHLGNRGFYAEFTTVVRAMIYAHCHHLRLWLCSEVFGYRCRLGWQDYFAPFCDEYDPTMDLDPVDHCYSNTRGPGTLFRDVRWFSPEEINLGPITVRGNEEILRFFALLLFRLPPHVEQQAREYIDHLDLPSQYNAIHIRRGDKVELREDMYYPTHLYLDHLIKTGFAGLPLFIMSDDFEAVREVEGILRERGLHSRIITLCNETHTGFDIHALRGKTSPYRRGEENLQTTNPDFKEDIFQETVRLFAETMVAARSTRFVGTRRSNIGWMVRALHDAPHSCTLMTSDQPLVTDPLAEPEHQYYLDHTSEYRGEAGHEALLKHLVLHLQPEANPNRTILLVEVGTCAGKFLPHLEQLAPEDNCVIVGFEPNPLNCEILNGIQLRKPFLLLPSALSNTTGNQTLFTLVDQPQNRPGYSLASLRGDGDAIAQVKVDTFDRAVDSLDYDDMIIRFVKIDTEGNDTNVIRGMVQHLPITQYIVFESSDCLDDRRGPGEQTPLRNIIQFLDVNGFDTYKLGEKRLLRMNGDHWHDVYENTKFHSNCFALKKDDPIIHAICDEQRYFRPLPASAPAPREEPQVQPESPPQQDPDSAPEESIHSMQVAQIDDEPFYLFFDLFVHWTGTKITAAGPHYGADIDWAEHQIDLDHVVLTTADISVTGQYILHKPDSWEPAILLDFESQELLALIRKGEPLDVTITAGPCRQSFTLDCTPSPHYPVAVSLMIRDENRWIKYYIDYYLQCLQVSHVFVYDNYTSDREGLKSILAPYIRRGQVTYILWDYRRRQRIAEKHIAQTVQEAHTLNRYGATPWIGFFDIDEFLRIPDRTLPQFLAEYDPDSIHGLSFAMRWFMYKGDADFQSIGNPLFTHLYSRPNRTGRKRQKLFVSARHVRFIRLHWLEDGKTDTPVLDPDIFIHHYYTRFDRFTRGKDELSTDYDDYMLRFSSLLEAANTQPAATERILSHQEGVKVQETRNAWIQHVRDAFDQADTEQSKLSREFHHIEGLCGAKTRHLLNNLCAFDGCSYLEIHTLAGASLCAAIFGNTISATAVDAWSRYGSPQEPFFNRITAVAGGHPPTILQGDPCGLDIHTIPTCNVFYYGAYQRGQSPFQAIQYYHPRFDAYTILIVEDWNREDVREGVKRSLLDLDLHVLFEREVILPPQYLHGMPLHRGAETWWNGIYVACVEKKGAEASSDRQACRTTPRRTVSSNHLPLEVVIFSKDRACQLDALLRSMHQFVRVDHHKTVLYTSSTDEFDRSYDLVTDSFSGVAFVKEMNFKNDLLDILGSAKDEQRHILLLVDDSLFTRLYTGGDNLAVFDQDEDILTISLRLGENITYCQVRQIETIPHDFSRSNTWKWRDAHVGYWNYPMSVDGHIFRATDIVSLIERLEFTNPNTLEAGLCSNPIERPLMLAERRPYTVNLSLNRVQEDIANPHGEITAEELNEAYLRGERIDFGPILSAKFHSCHVTPNVRFMSGRTLPAVPPGFQDPD